MTAQAVTPLFHEVRRLAESASLRPLKRGADVTAPARHVDQLAKVLGHL